MLHTERSRRHWPWIVGLGAITVVVVGVTLGVHVARFRAFEQRVEELDGRLVVEVTVPGALDVVDERWLRPFGRITAVELAGRGRPADADVAELVDRLVDEPHLRAFVVADASRLTDASGEALSGLPSLERLDLYGSQIGDAGLAELSQLPRLRHLALARSDVTDDGLKHLKSARMLEVLELDETYVSDEGMATLARLPRLRTLSLSQTMVTDAGANVLYEAHPEAQVWDD